MYCWIKVFITGILMLASSVAAYGQDVSRQQIKGLDEQVQEIKTDILSIAAELNQLEEIDIAFLAMDSKFNMTPENAAEAAKVFMPKILYPYHFADTDPSELKRLLKDTKEIDVRIRDMKKK